MRLPIVVSAVLPLIVVPEPTTYPTALTGLSDVSVTEGSAIDGKALAWNNGASKWEAITVVTSIPTVTLLGLPDVDATGVADTYVMSYHAATSKVQFVAPSALASLPALSSVGDVTYGAGPGLGDGLVWNGSQWAPSVLDHDLQVREPDGRPRLVHRPRQRVPGGRSDRDDAPVRDGSRGRRALSFYMLSDVSVSGAATGQVLTWNGTAWANRSKADLPCGSLTAHTGSVTLDRNNGEVQRVQLTGNVTLSVTNWPASGQLGRLVLEIQNTGAYNITAWPSGTIWPGGVAPTVTSGSGKKDIIILMSFDGGTTIYGSAAGQNYS